MTTQYTTILKLALPVQGELSGTWGDVVNDNITQMVEQAVAGLAVIDSWTANSHTLTTADGTTSESRCAMLSFTDTGTALTGAGTVICPANSKVYIAKNTTGQVITLKTSAGTGIAIPNGKSMLLFCDGTNVVEAVDHVVTLSAGTLTVTGLTTFASLKGTDTTTVTTIKDEDDMSSDSATALATQQSIKAYVDSQVGTVDTLAEILANGNTTGGTDIAVSTGDDITFADSSKAIFGAGSDLQIGHDGSVSFITDSGTGDLYIQGSSAIRLTNPAGNETFAVFNDNGAASLYYDNGVSLSTTATGVDITGTLVSDGLTVDTDTLVVDATNNRVGIGTDSPDTLLHLEGADGVPQLKFLRAGTVIGGIIRQTSNPYGLTYDAIDGNAGAPTHVFRTSVDGSTFTERMRIDVSGNVGIGTATAPGSNGKGLAIYTSDYPRLTFRNSTTGDGATNGTQFAAVGANFEIYNKEAGYIEFGTNNTERMRIDSSGNVGIGTTTITSGFKMEVIGDARFGDVVGDDAVELGWSAGGSEGFIQVYDRGASAFRPLNINNSLKVDASGNVGIGTSSPSSIANYVILETQGDTTTTGGIYYSSSSDSSQKAHFYIGGGTGYLGTQTNHPLAFTTNNTERMRIDSNGVMSLTSVGTVAASAINNRNVSGDGGYYTQLGSNCSNTSSWFMTGAITGVGNKFYIYGNGDIVNTNNSYGAISDEKLKENIVDSSSQWDDIKALRVRKYSMKADNLDAPNMLGVIAQEVEAAGMGGLVYESPDIDSEHNDLGTVTKQVNYSILYMKAVKALQEAMDRIETLEAKVAALES